MRDEQRFRWRPLLLITFDEAVRPHFAGFFGRGAARSTVTRSPGLTVTFFVSVSRTPPRMSGLVKVMVRVPLGAIEEVM